MKEVILQLNEFCEFLDTIKPAYLQLLELSKQDKIIKYNQNLVKKSK